MSLPLRVASFGSTTDGGVPPRFRSSTRACRRGAGDAMLLAFDLIPQDGAGSCARNPADARRFHRQRKSTTAILSRIPGCVYHTRRWILRSCYRRIVAFLMRIGTEEVGLGENRGVPGAILEVVCSSGRTGSGARRTSEKRFKRSMAKESRVCFDAFPFLCLVVSVPVG